MKAVRSSRSGKMPLAKKSERRFPSAWQNRVQGTANARNPPFRPGCCKRECGKVVYATDGGDAAATGDASAEHIVDVSRGGRRMSQLSEKQLHAVATHGTIRKPTPRPRSGPANAPKIEKAARKANRVSAKARSRRADATAEGLAKIRDRTAPGLPESKRLEGYP
ncbi:hypothetical protein [Rhodovulum sp. ES.010]|uniref:hypothetical protein n=1 Tax=Rhodovulum sp. ES.010 TaxID=1882821 RepID=UPI0015881BE2|nr:hypothetical protein [Rhodovulum sp. ES.010]